MLPQNPEFYQALLDQMSEGVCLVDRRRRITYWNQGATRLTGYTAKELVGRGSWDDILWSMDAGGENLNLDACSLAEPTAEARGHGGRAFLRHKQGRRVPVAVRTQPLFNMDGQVVGGIEIFSDDTAQVEAQRRAEEMRSRDLLDPTTLLPNRRFMEISLKRAFSEFEAYKNPFGILTIDLDRCKEINDTWGHAAGDTVLKETAGTLVGALRPTGVVGKWGGDKFLAIAYNMDDGLLNALVRRCESLVAQMSVPIPTNGRMVNPSISVGAALANAGELTEELLKRAEEVLSRSKAARRGTGHRRVVRGPVDATLTPQAVGPYPFKTISN